jgi:hypothetical protein
LESNPSLGFDEEIIIVNMAFWNQDQAIRIEHFDERNHRWM